MNRANFDIRQINDSEFVLNGERYQNYGNYMELQLIEKYDKSRSHIDVLVTNGLKGRIQGPRKANELVILLNTNNYMWSEEIDNMISESALKEKDVITKARINQSIYRDMLLNKHKKCCLCGVSDRRMLIASHIKLWSRSESEEKIDVYNGLLLCPNHDKLFDSGLLHLTIKGT